MPISPNRRSLRAYRTLVNPFGFLSGWSGARRGMDGIRMVYLWFTPPQRRRNIDEKI